MNDSDSAALDLVEHKSATTFVEIVSIIESAGPDRSWFRGQGSSSWGLVPSLMRAKYSKYHVPNDDGIANFEFSLKLEFQNLALPYLPTSPGANTLMWLLWMQHYGIPTRLLDWSTSPLVALFFALEGDSGHDRALWMMNHRMFNLAHFGHDGVFSKVFDQGHLDRTIPGFNESERDDDDVTMPVSSFAFLPPRIHDRLTRQSSRFIYCGGGDCLTQLIPRNDYLERFEPNDRKVFTKVSIPAEAVAVIRTSVMRMGVTRESLFGGLDDICSTILDRQLSSYLSHQARLKGS
jgi:hypothetical protein